jgi:hypothetical protein
MPDPLIRLQKISFEQINMPDRSYRFVTTKGFQWMDEELSDQHLIASLITPGI